MSAADDVRGVARGLLSAIDERRLTTVLAGQAARELEEIALRVEALEAAQVPPGLRAEGVVSLADARQRRAVEAWMEGRGALLIDGGQV